MSVEKHLLEPPAGILFPLKCFSKQLPFPTTVMVTDSFFAKGCSTFEEITSQIVLETVCKLVKD